MSYIIFYLYFIIFPFFSMNKIDYNIHSYHNNFLSSIININLSSLNNSFYFNYSDNKKIFYEFFTNNYKSLNQYKYNNLNFKLPIITSLLNINYSMKLYFVQTTIKNDYLNTSLNFPSDRILFTCYYYNINTNSYRDIIFSNLEIKFEFNNNLNYYQFKKYYILKMDIYNKNDCNFNNPCIINNEFNNEPYDYPYKYKKFKVYQNLTFTYIYNDSNCIYLGYDKYYNYSNFICKNFNNIQIGYYLNESEFDEKDYKEEWYVLKCYNKINYDIKNNIFFWINFCIFILIIILGISTEFIIKNIENWDEIAVKNDKISNYYEFNKEKEKVKLKILNIMDVKDNSKIPLQINMDLNQNFDKYIVKNNIDDNINQMTSEENIKKQSENYTNENTKFNLSNEKNEIKQKNSKLIINKKIFSFNYNLKNNFITLHPILNIISPSILSPLYYNSILLCFTISSILFFNNFYFNEKYLIMRIYNKKRNNFFYPIYKEFNKIIKSIFSTSLIKIFLRLFIFTSFNGKQKLIEEYHKNNTIEKIKLIKEKSSYINNRGIICIIFMLIFFIIFIFYTVVFSTIFENCIFSIIYSSIWSLLLNWILFSNIYIIIISFIENKFEAIGYYMKIFFLF